MEGSRRVNSLLQRDADERMHESRSGGHIKDSIILALHRKRLPPHAASQSGLREQPDGATSPLDVPHTTNGSPPLLQLSSPVHHQQFSTTTALLSSTPPFLLSTSVFHRKQKFVGSSNNNLNKIQSHPTYPYNYYTQPLLTMMIRGAHIHTHTRGALVSPLSNDIADGTKDLARTLFLKTNCFHLRPEASIW